MLLSPASLSLSVSHGHFVTAFFAFLLCVLLVLRLRKPRHGYQAGRTSNQQAVSSPSPEHDVCIVGAGVAGCTLSILLAKQGRKILLIERNLKTQRKIVGELMQPIGMELLRKFGLQSCVENIDAQEIEGYTIFLGDETVQLPYPAEAGKGFSFTHHRFIANLRARVREQPNIDLVEALVTKLNISENHVVNGVVYREESTKVSHCVQSPLTIVADGCMSYLRKQCGDISSRTTTSKFVGLEVALPSQKRAFVMMAQPSPVLCYPITSSVSRMLIDVPMSENVNKFLHSPDLVSQLPSDLREPFVRAISASKSHPSMPVSCIDRSQAITFVSAKNAIFFAEPDNECESISVGRSCPAWGQFQYAPSIDWSRYECCPS